MLKIPWFLPFVFSLLLKVRPPYGFGKNIFCIQPLPSWYLNNGSDRFLVKPGGTSNELTVANEAIITQNIHYLSLLRDYGTLKRYEFTKKLGLMVFAWNTECLLAGLEPC
ncbi:MAG: hypothetical protein A2Z97_11880 [Bdellovibrionales bacterium GWB1_52_6]|nr:MAG: hypothetical protein A2Z97_11880 [Bdellovibrionales bacterium GWB1_52_6]